MSANDYQILARAIKRQTKGAISNQEMAYFRRAWAQPGALTGGVNWDRAALRSWMRGRTKDLTIYAPSLLVWGDRDAYLTTRTAEWTRRYVPDLTLKYIRGSSHWVQKESPETVNRYALDFLRGA